MCGSDSSALKKRASKTADHLSRRASMMALCAACDLYLVDPRSSRSIKTAPSSSRKKRYTAVGTGVNADVRAIRCSIMVMRTIPMACPLNE